MALPDASPLDFVWADISPELLASASPPRYRAEFTHHLAVLAGAVVPARRGFLAWRRRLAGAGRDVMGC